MSKKKHMYIRPPKGDTPVKVEPKFIDYDLPNRQGHQDPTYIVIHEVSLGTGRSPKEYNMERYANKISEDARNGRTIGYHYLVGDKQVYQFMEDDVATSHTGTEFGNHNSIGVERLICKGVNYEYATHNQAKLIETLEGDEKTGAAIVMKAIEEPVRQIAKNAGFDGSVVVNTILTAKKQNYGFNALKNEYTDMVKSGIIDPTKVSRSVLQNGRPSWDRLNRF